MDTSATAKMRRRIKRRTRQIINDCNHILREGQRYNRVEHAERLPIDVDDIRLVKTAALGVLTQLEESGRRAS